MSRLKNFLVTTLIGGFVVLLPLAIFVLLIKLIINLVSGLLAPISSLLKNELDLQVPDALISVIAFIIVILLCFAIGLFVRTRFGQNSLRYFERTYLLRLPPLWRYQGDRTTVYRCKKNALYRRGACGCF